MKSKRIFMMLCFLLCSCLLFACNKEVIISENNSDTSFNMEVSDYTSTLEEKITIEATQNASVSVAFNPKEGNIKVTLTDTNGKKILSMNQDATISNTPAVTHIYEEGTYQLTIDLSHYTGSFNVTWIINNTNTQEIENASHGISDDITVYGLLLEYICDSRVLTYTPIEIIDSSDTKRIKDLEAHGVELEFPNGYFIYQPNDSKLSFPVIQSVSVELLNDEFTLEKSSIDVVSERLEGHPPFFLCKLHIVGGKIIDIEERFVP